MFRSTAAVLASLVVASCATIHSPRESSPAGAATKSTLPPGEPSFVVADIEGRTSADLDALLGAPALTRIEGEGEFRRYAFADCSLIVILYPDEKGTKRVRRLDASALKSGEEKPDLDACLARGRE